MTTPHDKATARLQGWIGAVASICAARPVLVALLAAVLVLVVGAYDVRGMAIDTDSAQLISPRLPWRQREAALDAAFPGRTGIIAVVLDAVTPELGERAAALLTERLAERRDLFTTVRRPDGGPFFARNGLLFLPLSEVGQTTGRLIEAQPLLGALAADPSVRGVMGSLQLALEGVRRGDTSLNALQPALSALANSVEAVLGGRPAPLAWQSLLGARGPTDPRALRRFVLVQPRLDFRAMQPGEAATRFIRSAATAAQLDPAHGVRVRLTGEVPMADEEFATLGENALRNGVIMLTALLGLLWLAVRSARAVAAIVITLVTGLVLSTGFGLAMYGALNLISVAFAVLFVGLGVDFGIQYVVSYRAAGTTGARGSLDAVDEASRRTGTSLALAALAIAAGFFAFAPTDYRGISELGVIAGTGMLIAFFASISLLPALLRLMRVPAGRSEMALRWLAPLDRWLAAHRRRALGMAAAVALASLAALSSLRFDFDPLHLRSAATEAVATLQDLAADPQTSPDTAEILSPSLAAAQALAARLSALPEVEQVLTLASFVPDDQTAKLAVIQDASMLLDVTLAPSSVKPPPTDAEDVAAMRQTAASLRSAVASAGASAPAGRSTEAGAAATRFADALQALAKAPPAQRLALTDALVPGLRTMLAQASDSLHAAPVSIDTLPDDLRRDWLTRGGQARVEVFPRAAQRDAAWAEQNASLRRFVAAVRRVAPQAGGAAVAIQDAGDTIVGAFVEAGLWAALSTALLLAVVLRRAGDVLRTFASLALSGAATLALCVAFGIPLNDENIIALPLLLGIGVAFNIYFVLAWRRGEQHLLRTPIARGIVFSALTTATAFGSLWLSSHPGTSSMGQLLALSLGCTLASAMLFLPALLGPPPRASTDQP